MVRLPHIYKGTQQSPSKYALDFPLEISLTAVVDDLVIIRAACNKSSRNWSVFFQKTGVALDFADGGDDVFHVGVAAE